MKKIKNPSFCLLILLSILVFSCTRPQSSPYTRRDIASVSKDYCWHNQKGRLGVLQIAKKAHKVDEIIEYKRFKKSIGPSQERSINGKLIHNGTDKKVNLYLVKFSNNNNQSNSSDNNYTTYIYGYLIHEGKGSKSCSVTNIVPIAVGEELELDEDLKLTND